VFVTALKPRLHQAADEQHVAGNMLPVSRQHVSLCIQQQTSNKLAIILLTATQHVTGQHVAMVQTRLKSFKRTLIKFGQGVVITVKLGVPRAPIIWQKLYSGLLLKNLLCVVRIKPIDRHVADMLNCHLSMWTPE